MGLTYEACGQVEELLGLDNGIVLSFDLAELVYAVLKNFYPLNDS